MNQLHSSEAYFPLSAAQYRRWFLYQLSPERQGSHNNGFSARLHGRVDPQAIASAMRQLVARHPMLRTSFTQIDGLPMQSIGPVLPVSISSVRVSEMNEAELACRVQADCAQPFDLTQASLVRLHLYHVSDDETVMLLVFDHLVCDGWSYWQILDELGVLLSAAESDMCADDKEPGNSQSYRAYIEWQKEWLKSVPADAQWHYWKKQLGGQLPTLQLPIDRQRPQVSSDRQGLVTLKLAKALTSQLNDLASNQACTLFTVLLAAYKILLHRLSGQNDIIVGSPLPARVKREWDRVIGDFVNPVALRTQFDSEQSVSSALRSVRDTALRGMLHQDYPFDQLVEKLQPSRLIGEHPIFQTMFIFQKARHGVNLLALWNGGDEATSISWGGFNLSAFPVYQSGGAATSD